MDERPDDTVLIQIPGVDEKKGLALYDDNQKVFIAILRSFVSNTLSVIDKLRNVSEETLPDYAINVHGLKGISAGIGAEKVREAAYNMEMMAKSGNFEGILAGNAALLTEAENLLSAIKAWLEKFDSRDSRPILPCPDMNLLIRLGKCCQAYDMNGADEAMDELESAVYETDALLVMWLREKVDECDFSSVAERLSEYGKEK